MGNKKPPEEYIDDDVCEEEELCPDCGGEGWIILDMNTIDDTVNMCDGASGGELGDCVKCTNCGGTGLAKDCRYW